MLDYKLGLIESKFAEIVWENAPMTTRELVALCAAELHWKRTTTYTILKKLCEKGFFETEHSVVTARISKEEYHSIQSERFVEDTFQGSLPAMLVAFGARKKLSEAEIEELQRVIDGMRG